MSEYSEHFVEDDILYSQGSNSSDTLISQAAEVLIDQAAQKENLLKGFQDYLNSQVELCKDNVNLLEIFPHLLKLQNEKGRVYGRSYAKHGDLSIFFNLERKWDRIYNIMERVMKEGMESLYSESSSTPTETFLDTVVDLGMYSLMWAGYIKETHPEMFEKFMRSNQL